MVDELVTYETAKLANVNGFDIPTYSAYVNFEEQGLDEEELKARNLPKIKLVEFQSYAYCGALKTKVDELPVFDFNSKARSFYSAPTQSLLRKWLRDNHNIDIEIRVGVVNEKYYVLLLKDKLPLDIKVGRYFKTYEKALEKGLLIGLKQI